MRIPAPSSAVRRFGIVMLRHIRDRIRIAQHSAGQHLDRRSCPPDAPVTLWTTREIEPDRFRSTDGRVDRSVMMMAGNSRRTAALTDALDSSRHSGPVRSFASVMSASLRGAATAVFGELGAVYPYRLLYPCDCSCTNSRRPLDGRTLEHPSSPHPKSPNFLVLTRHARSTRQSRRNRGARSAKPSPVSWQATMRSARTWRKSWRNSHHAASTVTSM